MIKPDEIKAVEFDMSVLGGYKRETVDSFFDAVVNDYEKLYNENSELVQKLKLCVEKIEEYQKDEKFLKAAIINAEKLNENSLRDIEAREKEIEQLAKEKAENMVQKAKLEAETILASSKSEADSILIAAKSEADNILIKSKTEAAEAIKKCEIESAEKIAKINSTVEIETDKLNRLKKEVADFKESVLKLYKDHLNSLSKLPEFSAESVEKKPENAEIKKEEVKQPISEEIVKTEPVQESTQEVDFQIEEVHTEPEIKLPAIHDSKNEKTAEFVIEKKNIDNKKDSFEKNFKFQGLKFGADFDIKNDK